MPTPLLLVIPLSAADLPLTTLQLATLSSLGPYPHTGVLFVADHSLTKDQYSPLVATAKPLFSAGELISTPLDLPDPTHPRAHNFRFETAARHVMSTRHLPFLYLLPRCVPMRRGWLTELEAEYSRARKPFMGHLLTPESDHTAKPFLSSSAIYPADLPKRILQRLISQRQIEWEQSCADLIVPLAHPTTLIHVVPGRTDSEVNLSALPKAAALIHTTAARRLTAALRGEPAPAPVAEPVAEAAPKPAPASALVAPPPKSAFYHSGNYGDVIYSLAAIKLSGGGSLSLGPRQKRTPPCSSPIRKEAYPFIAPLIAAQPYITSCSFTDRHPGTDSAFDLNRYRTLWSDSALRSRTNIHNLAQMHCQLLGIAEQFHPSQSWLTVPSPIPHGYFTCHRSSRYQDPEFPWKLIVSILHRRLLFVGTPSEHADFTKKFGRVSHWHPIDALELARLLAGSLGFLGNQSLPCAIALGLGLPVCQEVSPQSPDCRFPRPNFLPHPFTAAQLGAWASLPAKP